MPFPVSSRTPDDMLSDLLADHYQPGLVLLLSLTAMAAVAAAVMLLAAHRARARTRRAEQQRERALEERARVLALYDGHTMMRNRASFQQEIVSLIQRCERSGQQFDLFYGSLRFGDLPDDESVHEAMRLIAQRLQPLTRSTDLLARYSRTEFTLLRPRLHEADASRRPVAGRLLAAPAGRRSGGAGARPRRQRQLPVRRATLAPASAGGGVRQHECDPGDVCNAHCQRRGGLNSDCADDAAAQPHLRVDHQVRQAKRGQPGRTVVGTEQQRTGRRGAGDQALVGEHADRR
jgi:GGDEF domain-containing protein